MKTHITITGKGQLTIPAAARRQLGLKEKGDKVLFKLNPRTKSATISKPQTIEEISTYLTSKIKPGTEPLLNADEYYQKHRGKYI
jgi:AbrB family looped-hinge helix DNA binding protein